MNTEDFLEKVYAEISDNIKFLEAKNGALITFNSALIVLCGNIVFDSSIAFLYRVLVSFALLFLIIPISLSIFSFRATVGNEGRCLKFIYRFLDLKNDDFLSSDKYMYYAYIHRRFNNNPIEYLKSISVLNESVLKKSLLYHIASQIVDLSKVAYYKAIIFNIAIKFEFIYFLCGFFIAIFILIVKCIFHQ